MANNDPSLLFTLDVVALYPSISIEMGLQAMKHSFSLDTQFSEETKVAV